MRKATSVISAKRSTRNWEEKRGNPWDRRLLGAWEVEKGDVFFLRKLLNGMEERIRRL